MLRFFAFVFVNQEGCPLILHSFLEAKYLSFTKSKAFRSFFDRDMPID